MHVAKLWENPLAKLKLLEIKMQICEDLKEKVCLRIYRVNP